MFKFGSEVTFLPQMEKAILPPSSSPAGMLLMPLMRSPAHAHITSGFKDIDVPSFSTSPSKSFAIKRIKEKLLKHS